MRILLFVSLLQAAPPATPPSPEPSPELRAAGNAWSNCLGASQDRLQGWPEAPAEVVRMILSSCGDREIALRNAMRDWMATWTDAATAEREADEGIAESRQAFHDGIMRMILQRRATRGY